MSEKIGCQHSKDYQFVCQNPSCNFALICHNCLANDHIGHKMMLLKTYIEKEVTETPKEIIHLMREYKIGPGEKLNNGYKEIKENVGNVKGRIRRTYEKVIRNVVKDLHEQMERRLNDVNQAMGDIERKMKDQRMREGNIYSQAKELLRALKGISKLPDYSQLADLFPKLLQMKSLLISKIKLHNYNLGHQWQITYNNMLQHNYEIKLIDLENIHFTQIGEMAETVFKLSSPFVHSHYLLLFRIPFTRNLKIRKERKREEKVRKDRDQKQRKRMRN